MEELSFRRVSLHLQHDAKRLEHGEDLNDALLDFFVKLGQLLIPCGGLEGGFPSVAYLGSLFYDVLRSRGATDGRTGHTNVQGWARRRLGQGGLFFDGIGALAVPINETLRDNKGKERGEKHWWLALLLNPRAGGRSDGKEKMSLLCLDSLARADFVCVPPIRALKGGHHTGYPLELLGLTRRGIFVQVHFRAKGDGSAGPLPDPRHAKLTTGGREFSNPYVVEMKVDQRGDVGRPGQIEGTIEFALDSPARMCTEYTLHYGGPGVYSPEPRLTMRRDPGSFQKEVSRFLGGYMAKEWEVSRQEGSDQRRAYNVLQVESEVRLPDVPQQETSNDCGYFILEQILMSLQLTPEDFRILSQAPADLVARLPWPSQKDIARRKARLREAIDALSAAANAANTADVEVLLKGDEALRHRIQAALWDGPRFTEAARSLAAFCAPRQRFTIQDLGTKSTKELRALCVQNGVLPAGAAERADFVRALVPLAVIGDRGSPPAARDGPKAGEASRPTAAPTAANAAAAGAASQGAAADGEAAAMAAAEREVEAAFEEARRQGGRCDTATQGEWRQCDPAAHLSTMRFTAADLEKMPLKTLRGLCVQHKVVPKNVVERADFVKALMPLVDPEPVAARGAEAASPTRAAEESRNGKSADAATAPSEGAPAGRGEKRPAEHLSTMRFTEAELAKLPLKTLRGLCIQHKVLPPAGAVERADFERALLPLAVCSAAPAADPGQREAQSGAAAPEEPPLGTEERKAKWQKVAATGEHLAGLHFEEADLAVMPMKTLRGLCTQHKVLPPGAVERADFVQALRPLIGATSSAAKAAPAAPAVVAPPPAVAAPAPPKRDFTKFLGSMKPNFTAADLEEMPDTTLRTLCMQHGALPPGESQRDDLLKALTPLALRSATKAHYEDIMQLDEDEIL